MKQKLKTIKKRLTYLKNKFQNANFTYLLIKDNKKITNSEFLPKPIRVRNPGVDLGRILGMLGIIIHHILLHGKGFHKYRQYKDLYKLNTAIFWHVSTYIFISGYIGYKSTKYSNVLYLWFCVLFYSIAIIKYFTLYKPYKYKQQIKLMYFFPVLTKQYWYFTKFFGMYLFLPVVNKGIENIKKSEFKIMIITLIGVYIVLKDYMVPHSDIFNMNRGYSVIFFLIFYLTGAYFGRFKKDRSLIEKTIYNIIYILIFFNSTILCFILPNYQINNGNPKFKDKFINFLKYLFITRINAIPMILQSITLMLFITNINYNKFFAKIITFIGPLTFGVYLIHENKIIRAKIMKNILKNYSSHLPYYTVIKIILVKALKIFGKCTIIDYLRNILFRICQIRRICILIEKLIFFILG